MTASLTSIDKAFEVCEALSQAPRGLSLSELARALRMPAPTLHRTLAVLRRRGYARQDEETQRYGLTLKMLDLSFQLLGRSELRLHAYPVLREYALRSGLRSFLAIPARNEVTYIWAAGAADEIAMRTVYGRDMPAHCAIYFPPALDTRRLSCLKLVDRGAVMEGRIDHLGPTGADGAQRLCCTCAPVHDYSGREVARVGVFAHRPDDRALAAEYQQAGRDLARQISIRLGHLPAAALAAGA